MQILTILHRLAELGSRSEGVSMPIRMRRPDGVGRGPVAEGSGRPPPEETVPAFGSTDEDTFRRRGSVAEMAVGFLRGASDGPGQWSPRRER